MAAGGGKANSSYFSGQRHVTRRIVHQMPPPDFQQLIPAGSAPTFETPHPSQ